MARRTPKPFTFEVRKGGRKTRAVAASWPTDPMATDHQPAVSWLGLEEAPGMAVDMKDATVVPELAAGRILPALDDPQPLAAVAEPKRRGRGHAKAKPDAAEDLAAGIVAPKPIAFAAKEPSEAVTAVSGAKDMANVLVLRPSRKRLLRSEFKRGERWKARLPVTTFKRDRRKRMAL